MRSVWLCSRNDAIGNAAVTLAALGVFGTGTNWPDLGMAAMMAVLGLTASRTVIAPSRRELREGADAGITTCTLPQCEILVAAENVVYP